jgi:predicted ATP-dependent endonuclease of OLD family
LNNHYEKHFEGIMDVIQDLGVPSVNDRKMRIVSTLNPEVALQGSTDLLYVDPDLNHELPEAYNGLGFKNLVFMAIQISHFHLQWMNTEDKRPLCQIIFIEEPEAHLHAQVQQTFISNIWAIIEKASKNANEEHMIPQLGITTHSSHILDAVEFSKVRYFQRCLQADDAEQITTLNASKVFSLRDFGSQKESTSGTTEDQDETLAFLKRYLRLTHCDLFFADAAILVEGTVEKLLLTDMIDKSAPRLKRNYLTVLEIGGAYAHRFSSLVEFLGIPYLVITDLDSVDPENNRKVCRADKSYAITSNASIKFYFNKQSIAELISLDTAGQVFKNNTCYVAFQKSSEVADHDKVMIGRTLEETFIYENIALFRNKKIAFGENLPEGKDFEEEYKNVFNTIKASAFKKTEFALNVASSTSDWVVPKYIADGLIWLEDKIAINATEEID